MKGIVIKYGMFAKNKVMMAQKIPNESWTVFLFYAGMNYRIKFWVVLPWIWM